MWSIRFCLRIISMWNNFRISNRPVLDVLLVKPGPVLHCHPLKSQFYHLVPEAMNHPKATDISNVIDREWANHHQNTIIWESLFLQMFLYQSMGDRTSSTSKWDGSSFEKTPETRMVESLPSQKVSIWWCKEVPIVSVLLNRISLSLRDMVAGGMPSWDQKTHGFAQVFACMRQIQRKTEQRQPEPTTNTSWWPQMATLKTTNMSLNASTHSVGA